MFVGVCRLTLIASHCHSLKEKRSVVRKIKDRVRARYDLTVTEVGGQDTWQRAALAFAMVDNERAHLETTLDKVVRFVEDMGVAGVVADDRDILVYGDEAFTRGGERW